MFGHLNEIILTGEIVELVPLETSHRNELLQAASDGKLWELWYTSVPSEETVDKYIAQALENRKQGVEFPFSVIHRPSGRIIGSTRYYNIQPEHRRLEIGYTWYAASFQRTAVNTACKLLLLEYAFETLGCIAVQFITHSKNERSRNAIIRIGATLDGILRNHRILPDGSIRDSAVYSITNTDWPRVRSGLLSKLNP